MLFLTGRFWHRSPELTSYIGPIFAKFLLNICTLKSITRVQSYFFETFNLICVYTYLQNYLNLYCVIDIFIVLFKCTGIFKKI